MADILVDRYGNRIYTEPAEANAYEQTFELDDGTALPVITIRVGEEYLDMSPDVAARIRADLEIAVPRQRILLPRTAGDMLRAKEQRRGRRREVLVRRSRRAVR